MLQLISFYTLLLLYFFPQESLEDFGWLEGLWQNTESSNSYEEWYWDEAGNRWNGRGYRVVNKDTIVYETITIEHYKGSIHYIPVIEENVGAVPFIITRYNKKGFESENTKHDFPKSIAYQNKGKKLIATVSGNGKTQEFRMQKVR